MMRIVVGRIASIHGKAITTAEAKACDRVMVGDRFVVSANGERPRPGVHEVERIDLATGVILTADEIADVSPTATRDDYILITDRSPRWSPYS